MNTMYIFLNGIFFPGCISTRIFCSKSLNAFHKNESLQNEVSWIISIMSMCLEKEKREIFKKKKKKQMSKLA